MLRGVHGRPLLLLASALAATAASAGVAHAVTISESEVTRTVHCSASDRTVRIDGAEAHLTITGRCRSLVVNGAEAHVKAGTVDRITVTAAEARITYRRSSSGGRARVSITGQGSTVRRVP